jgi:3-oxoacyl-[acyl-carrier-protein] synthase III
LTSNARILGSGFVVGEHLVPNATMAKVCDTSDEWIRERSGIQQRYFVKEGTATRIWRWARRRRRSMTRG